MDEKMIKKIEKYAILAMILVVVYLLVVNPFIKFKKNEKILGDAVKKYYEINESKLPTGRRIDTVTLKTLYDEKYIEENLSIPLGKTYCSEKNSWGKVTKVDSELKYYIYLECGMYKTKIDHTGPEIKLKGDEEITVGRYSEFKDPGIESVVDKKDGEMDVKDVTVDGEVNTNENGTYEITYTAYDKLKNKTTVVRKVKVVQVLKDTIKKETKIGYYKGMDPNNYIYFGNNLFRIIGLEGNNVKIISETDVGNVNYQSLDEYLKMYYDTLPDSSKKYVVKNKYCNMQVGKNFKVTDCTQYTKERELYLPSIDEINKSMEDGFSYLITGVIDWTANDYDGKNAYAVREYFFDSEDQFLPQEYYNIYGVRPVITIKGDVELVDGKGTYQSPYRFNDVKIGEGGDNLYSRYAGEYVRVEDDMFRIVEAKEGEPTKVISLYTMNNDGDSYEASNKGNSGRFTYNPKKVGNIGYIINNKVPSFISASYFVKHKITVPIYKKHYIYGKEVSKKEYTVKFSAPSAFDLYNINPYAEDGYWLLNESKDNDIIYVMSQLGSIYDDDQYTNDDKHGIKVCGYLKKDLTIVSGEGTKKDPYVVK